MAQPNYQKAHDDFVKWYNTVYLPTIIGVPNGNRQTPSSPPRSSNSASGARYDRAQARAYAAASLAYETRRNPNTCPDAGVRAGEIVGWRAWEMGSGCLRSLVVTSTIWQPNGIIKGNPGIKSPYYPLYEGIYAFKTEAQALNLFHEYPYAPSNYVVGTVELWGEVHEHENGYRAQYAQPLELVHFFGPDRDNEMYLFERLKTLFDRLA